MSALTQTVVATGPSIAASSTASSSTDNPPISTSALVAVLASAVVLLVALIELVWVIRRRRRLSGSQRSRLNRWNLGLRAGGWSSARSGESAMEKPTIYELAPSIAPSASASQIWARPRPRMPASSVLSSEDEIDPIWRDRPS